MISAISKNGKKVYLSFNPDCEENEGGWFVEVYFNPYGDYEDYFCIHTDDCDCKDEKAVEEYAIKYIAEETYDFEDGVEEKAYRLMVMLGEIKNELERGGEPVTLKEIEELYGLASDINEFLDEQ